MGQAARALFRLPIRHPVPVLLVAVAVAVAMGATGAGVSDRLSRQKGDFYSHESESFRATHELETNSKGSRNQPNLAVIIRRDPTRSAALRIQAQLKRMPSVARVEKYVFSSRDENSSLVIAWLRKGPREELAASEIAQKLERPGVVLGGSALARWEFGKQVEHDLTRAELIAFPLLLLIGLWVFRSVVSALLPLLLGGFTLLCAIGSIRLMTELFPLSVFSLNIVAALALGLGVDYSLLMVSRFREQLSDGLTGEEAAWKTLRTAGRTVAFSSAAIAASLAALLVFPIPFVRSIACGGMLAALIAGLGALFVLPALLVLLGDRVNAVAPPRWRRIAAANADAQVRGRWHRVAQFVLRRPKMMALASAALLIALALPALQMRLTGFDGSALPASSNARAFALQLRQEFPNPILGEIEVAIHGNRAVATEVAENLSDFSSRTKLVKPFPVGLKLNPRLWQINLNPTAPVFSDQAKEAVRLLRWIDAPITVGGETAGYLDTAATLRQYLPRALAVLVAAALLFLFLATRSLVLPAKALVMNVLSLGASFGLLVLVFQDGRFEEFLDYQSQGALALTLPIILTAGAFGLLTDYGIFLLMRIKEARDEGLPDQAAIAVGLERTGRIITAAALLFCVAVGAFATSEIIFVKEGAIGIVVAVLLDAFVVRPVLVPSLMAILGRWNWWPRAAPDSRSEVTSS